MITVLSNYALDDTFPNLFFLQFLEAVVSHMQNKNSINYWVEKR